MTPLRILILAVLLYVAWKLLFFRRKKNLGNSQFAPPESPETFVDDTLVEDPVCHRLVPKKQAVALYQHSPIFFCSEQCRRRYRNEQGETK